MIWIATIQVAADISSTPPGFLFARKADPWVPEGHAIIAQRFSVGNLVPVCVSPEGTADRSRIPSAAPSGLRM